MTKSFYLWFLFGLLAQAGFAQETHSIQVVVDQKSPCTSVDIDLEQPENFSIYPNPAEDYFIIELGVDATIKLFDLTGREILYRKAERGSINLNVRGLSKGIYIVKIQYYHGFFTDKVQIK